VNKQTVFSAAAILILLICISVMAVGNRSYDQPIEFNHYKHFVELDVECQFCHQTVAENDVAGLPNIDICIFCHEEGVVNENPRFHEVVQIIREYSRRQEKIKWNRIYDSPSHVIFSHRIHVGAGVECESCHGITGKSKRPSGQPELISMESCMDCHRKSNVETDCLICHK